MRALLFLQGSSLWKEGQVLLYSWIPQSHLEIQSSPRLTPGAANSFFIVIAFSLYSSLLSAQVVWMEGVGFRAGTEREHVLNPDLFLCFCFLVFSFVLFVFLCNLISFFKYQVLRHKSQSKLPFFLSFLSHSSPEEMSLEGLAPQIRSTIGEKRRVLGVIIK